MNDNQELEQVVDFEDDTMPDSEVVKPVKHKNKTHKKNWRIKRKKAQKQSKENRKRNR